MLLHYSFLSTETPRSKPVPATEHVQLRQFGSKECSAQSPDLHLTWTPLGSPLEILIVFPRPPHPTSVPDLIIALVAELSSWLDSKKSFSEKFESGIATKEGFGIYQAYRKGSDVMVSTFFCPYSVVGGEGRCWVFFITGSIASGNVSLRKCGWFCRGN